MKAPNTTSSLSDDLAISKKIEAAIEGRITLSMAILAVETMEPEQADALRIAAFGRWRSSLKSLPSVKSVRTLRFINAYHKIAKLLGCSLVSQATGVGGREIIATSWHEQTLLYLTFERDRLAVAEKIHDGSTKVSLLRLWVEGVRMTTKKTKTSVPSFYDFRANVQHERSLIVAIEPSGKKNHATQSATRRATYLPCLKHEDTQTKALAKKLCLLTDPRVATKITREFLTLVLGKVPEKKNVDQTLQTMRKFARENPG